MDKELLYKYFAGKAESSERTEVRRWVESSPENKEEFMGERRIYDLTSILGPEFEAAKVEKPSMWRRWVGRVAAAAVLVSATLGVDYVIDSARVDEVPMQTLVVPPGQRLNLTLADGTSVWLNSATTLRYPGVFRGKERHIEVDGEAFLTVAHNSEQPFTVGTSSGEIRVTGTVFNVDAYSASTEFDVELVEGSVEFTGQDRTFAIRGGQTLSRLADGSFGVRNVSNTTPDWVEGIVCFDQLTLREILKRFEKYYGVNIIYQDSLCAGQRYSGKFYLEDGAEHALNVLRHDLDFAYESDRDFHTIKIKASNH